METLYYKLWYHDAPIPLSLKIELLCNGIQPDVFYNMEISDYVNFGINFTKAQELVTLKGTDKYKKATEFLENNNIQLITFTDPEYPSRLKDIPAPPCGLFLRGKLPSLHGSISIIGARNATEYGRTAAFQLSSGLSKRGICVVSGMARGIDSCAHEGALAGGSPTVAVLGSGFQHIYPRENKKLYERILETGCVLTEYMPDCQPLPINFPQRNRIISGLSALLLVVEAGERSGSLITADFALDQGKNVLVVPGGIYNPKSIGTNKLIRDGARLVTSVEDIIEESSCLQNVLKNFTVCSRNQLSSEAPLNELQQRILETIKEGAASLEVISEHYQGRIELLLSALGQLECSGLIHRLYGKYYVSKL